MRLRMLFALTLGSVALTFLASCTKGTPAHDVPTDFMSSCMSFPLPDAPQATGEPLSMLLRPFLEGGGELTWETVSSNHHIVRVEKEDALTKTTSRMALELQTLPPSALDQASRCGSENVLVSRIQTSDTTLSGVEANLVLNQLLEASLSMSDPEDAAAATQAEAVRSDGGSRRVAGDDNTRAASTDGDYVHGNCRVTAGGRMLMNGECGGLARENTVFVTSSTDGCSVELTKAGDAVRAKLFAYKDVCWADEAKTESLDIDLDIGMLTMNQESCWVGPGSEICLFSGE